MMNRERVNESRMLEDIILQAEADASKWFAQLRETICKMLAIDSLLDDVDAPPADLSPAVALGRALLERAEQQHERNLRALRERLASLYEKALSGLKQKSISEQPSRRAPRTPHAALCEEEEA